MSNFNQSNFKDEYKKCNTYEDLEKLIDKMTPNWRLEVYHCLRKAQALVGLTMREEAFVRELKYRLDD